MSATRRLFKQSSHYLIGEIGIMLAGFISFPILTRVFSTEEYGILSLVSITVFILAGIAKLGMQHSAVRFYDEFESGKRNQPITVFYTTLLMGSLLPAVVIAFVFVIINMIVPSKLLNPDLMRLNWIIAGLIISESMMVRIMNFMRVEQKTKLYNLIAIVNRYSKLGLSIVILFFIFKSVAGYYLGTVIVECLIIVIFIGVLIKQNKIRFQSFSLPFFKENVQYGFPLVGRELASYVIKFTDRYQLQAFLGSAAVGLYSVGADFSFYVQNVIFFPIQYAIFPIYMELWNKEGESKTREFLSRVTDYMLMISIPIVFGVIALRKEIVVFLASSKYETAATVIPYILIGTIIWGFAPIINAGLYIHKKTKIVFSSVLLAGCLNIVLNLILIPYLGIVGASLASLISYVGLIVVTSQISFKYLKIDIDPTAILKYIGVAFLMYIAVSTFRIGVGFLSILSGVTLGAVVYMSIILIINKELRKSIFAFIRNRRLLLFPKKAVRLN